MGIFNMKLFKKEKEKSNLDLLFDKVMSKDSQYFDIQKRFIKFYLSHNFICVQKNRNSGFSAFMEEIAIAERNDKKNILYIKVGSYEMPKLFKEYRLGIGNIDFKTKRKIEYRDLAGKRYNIVIIDEAAFLYNLHEIIANINVICPDGKIVVCTTPSEKCDCNYTKLRNLFESSELMGNLFHFKRFDKLQLKRNLHLLSETDDMDTIINQLFGEFS